MNKPPTRLRDDVDWWPILSDPDFLVEPYSHLNRYRDMGAVHFDQQSGIYFILSHDAFTKIVKSPKMGRDTRAWTNGWTTPEYRESDPIGYQLFEAFQPQMINCDGADHRRMRDVYEPVFRSQYMRSVVDLIEEQASDLLRAMPDNGDIDFIDAYAAPLPLRVLCSLFGISAEHDDAIRQWSASLIKLGDILMSSDQKAEALTALQEFKAFLQSEISARSSNDGEDFLSLAMRAYDDGVLNEDETLTNLVSMLIAGHETTVTLIGNGMLLLLKQPDQMCRLRADPSLMRTAIEEFLRMEPGGNMILRVALDDFEVDGVMIPKGSPVIGLVGAINRDAARFNNPETLDIARTGNAQMTFGGGTHFCIGAPLARLEAQIAFSSVLTEFEHIEIVGEPEWRLDRLNARGLAHLPVKVCR